MKKALFTILALFLLSSVFGKAQERTSIPAADGRITYLGRVQKTDGAVKFDWAGVYARLRFQGSSLSVRVSDTKKNYYNVWLDRAMDAEPDKVIATRGSDTTLVLFSAEEIRARFGRKGSSAAHDVILQKRTEGEQGMTTLLSFCADGIFLQAEAPKERIIEYVGDSYTCGYGSENSVRTDPFTPETENQNKTYASILARYFDADYFVVAHSGMGIARNYNDNQKGWYMPERYLQTFDMDRESRWDPAAGSSRPDITLVYLGTNDFSTARQPSRQMFTENYRTLLRAIKASYGDDYPILCIAPKNDPGMYDYIRDAVASCGLKNVHVMALSSEVHDGDSDLGASWHPNYEGHKKKAYAILPYVATITGWALSDRPLR